MARPNEVVTVTVVFSKEPGGPRVDLADTVSWVEALLSGQEPEGCNSLRYSKARVVSVSLLNG